VKIAVIGVVTEDVPLSTHPKNIAGLKFDPPADVIKKYQEVLKDKTDIIIVLSHIGHSADRELARKVPGLAAIVGGHSHNKSPDACHDRGYGSSAGLGTWKGTGRA